MRRVEGLHLWIGNARDKRDVSRLHAEGIEAVVDLAAEELPAVLSRDLVYLRFPLLDGDECSLWLARMAVRCVERLVREEVPTLVVCSAGLSRSPAIAAVALAKVRGSRYEVELAALGPLDVSPGLWWAVTLSVDDYYRPGVTEGTG